MPVSSNEALSKLLFNQASEAFAITDLTGKTLEVNIAFLSRFHLIGSDILGKILYDTLLFSSSIALAEVFEVFFNSSSLEIKLENACIDTFKGYSYHAIINKIFRDQIPVGFIFNFTPTSYTTQQLSNDERTSLQKQSDALFQIAKKNFWQSGNIEECFRVVTSTTAAVLEVENCSVWLFEEGNDEEVFCKMIYCRSTNSFSSGVKLRIKNYPNYINILRNTGIIDADDSFTDHRTIESLGDYFIKNDIQSTLEVAINSGGQLFGVFCCEQVGKQKKWQLDEKNFARYISETIAHAISANTENKFKKDILIREKYFQSLIENSLDVIAIAGADTKYTYFSPSITRVLGYEKEELIGHSPFEFVHPDDHFLLITQYTDIMTEYGKTIHSRSRCIHKDGTWRNIEAVATNLLNIEGLNGIVMNFRDVTEKIQAEKEIFRKEKYFRLLTENSFDVRYTADKEGFITYMSPSVNEVLGFMPDEIVGRNGWHFIADDFKESMKLEWDRICNIPKSIMYRQFPILKKDGSTIEAELIAKNMLDDPDINGVIVTFRDVTERKIYELKLLESEEYFRSLIENSNDAMTILNAFGNRIYVSPSTEKLYGYTTDEMMGKSPFELLHPDDLETTTKIFQDLILHPDKVETIQVRIKHATKVDWVHIEITAKNMLHNPVVKGIVLNSRDITERVKIQQKLQDSEEYFRALIENSSDVISVVDEHGNRKFTSLSIYSVFGRNPEDVFGRNPMENIHPEDLPNIKYLLQQLIENPGVRFRTETRMSNANGEWLHVDAVGRNLIHNPAVKGIILNARDITETKKAQQQLALSEKYYRSLIENSNDMLAICNADGRFFYASPSVQRFLGYSNEEYLNSNLQDFIHLDFTKSCSKVLEKSLEHPGITFKQELFQKHKDGHYVYLETIFNNLINDEAVKGIVMISRDISDRKNAELMLQNYNMQLSTEVNNKTIELKTKNDKLEELLVNLQSAQALLIQSEKMASLGLLTAGIAHEINNPINFITANIKPLRRDILALKEFLETVENLDLITDLKKIKELKKIRNELEIDYSLEEIEQLLNGIEEGASRTFEIIKGLRNFSRLDESDLKMDDINQSINTTLMLLQSSFDQEIKIIKKYGNIPLIECYPGKLNQVFMNVIANAVQSIAGEGCVTICTWCEEETVKVSIKDTGKGISEVLKARIFDPFYTTKEVGEGTGLGLFISFGIIENHKGKIEVNSEEGKGTEVIISLPLIQSEQC